MDKENEEKTKKVLTHRFYRIIKTICAVFTVIILITNICLFISVIFVPIRIISLLGLFCMDFAVFNLFWWYIYMRILLPRWNHRIEQSERSGRSLYEVEDTMDEIRERLHSEIFSGRLSIPHEEYYPIVNDEEKESIPPKEFKINEYLTVKLEKNITNIYINGKLFKQCKYLLLNIPKENVDDYDSINSIDDVATHLNHDLEVGRNIKQYEITPEIEFIAHCSNLQAWYEYRYDTRILHSNISFPLLKRLTEVGDQDAKSVFKEEIAKRFVDGNESVRDFLMEENYLGFLNIEEILSIARVILEKEGEINLYLNLRDKEKEIILKDPVPSNWDLIKDEFKDDFIWEDLTDSNDKK